MSIEVANESGVAVDERDLERLARFVLDELGVHPLVELSIRLVDVEAMTALHVHFMDEQGPTDVLAFPMDELHDHRDDVESPDLPPTLLGDVVLCPAVAAEQAKQARHSTEAELEILLTHGILHLLGYDHAEAEQEREMFGQQNRLVTGWNVVRRR
ncbi:MAG TPA: rRNA maturation RNase YbeY [Mycobacteriales bacterium]|nr:rRNA maturation RNase YbeY [Mycobacteriales bacterium]